MDESFGHVLKSLREAAGLGLAGLAARTNYSKPMLGNIEAGRRRASLDLAVACDEVFGTAPLLTSAIGLSDGQEEGMRRRALLATIASTVGVAGLGGVTTLAEVIRHDLLIEGGALDWDAVLTDCGHRLGVDQSERTGAYVAKQLLLARQHLSTPDGIRGAALLMQLFGLWLGTQGETLTAHSWYRSAVALADRSGDPAARVYTRGRTASSGSYEGFTAAEALSISRRPSQGAMEAHSALVHVHTLGKNLPAARASVNQMQHMADRLAVEGAQRRTVLFRHYVESRLGARSDADRAWIEVEHTLKPTPVWYAESKIYRGLAQIRHGDIAAGLSTGLSAVKAIPASQPLGVAVADLLAHVPNEHTSDDRDELATYAAAGIMPWDTIQ